MKNFKTETEFKYQRKKLKEKFRRNLNLRTEKQTKKRTNVSLELMSSFVDPRNRAPFMQRQICEIVLGLR